MEKELENSEKKKGESSPNQPSRPSQTTRPRRLTGGPRLSAAILPRARPPSLASQWGQPVGASFLPRVLPLSLCLAGPVHQSPSRCPACPFLLSLRVDPTCQFRPLHTRRGPARVHSRTSPDFSATTLAHAPTRPAPFLEPRQCPAHTPRLISHSFTLSRALPTLPAATGDPRPRSRPSSSSETAPSLPELHPEVRHLSCAQFPLLHPMFGQFHLRRCSVAAVRRARTVTGRFSPV
jgi:hypothetical protein